jgi:hypothetical protein
MKKLKVKKETLKSMTAKYEAAKAAARTYTSALRYPPTQLILTVDVFNNESKQFNIMALVELQSIVRLSDARGERVVVSSPREGVIQLKAEKEVKGYLSFPTELL